MQYRENTLTSKDAETLQCYHWVADKPVGHLFLAHGLGEHAGRYDKVARHLAGKGISVHALDHRGHGRSTGVRGYVHHWTDYPNDLHLLYESVEDDGLPRYLLGHSMGGMVSILYALMYRDDFVRIALSGPAADISLPVPAWKVFAGKLLSSLAPRFTMPNDIAPENVCSVPAIVEAYASDPLVHNKVATRWFAEYLALIERVKQEASSIKTPMAIWHGEGDVVVEPWVSKQFYDRLTMEPRQYKVVDKSYHEILFEDNGLEIADEMLAWLQAEA